MISQILSVLFILITLCSKPQVHASPVFLWSNVELPQLRVPLSTIPSTRFISNYVCPIKAKQIEISIFSVNDLTIENIELGSQRNHPLVLTSKIPGTKVRYYRSVDDDIYEGFLSMPQSNYPNCAPVHFQLKSLENYKTLKYALDKMQEKIGEMATNQNNDVLFVLLSDPVNHEILSRERRQSQVSQSAVLISNDKTCMFYAKQLYWTISNGTSSMNRPYNLSLSNSSCEPIASSASNANSVVLRLIWENTQLPDIVNMSLTATIIGRYWHLKNVTLNGEDYRYFAYGMHDEMETPPTYSYVCTTATFVRYDSLMSKYGQYDFNRKFNIINLQFQPFHGSGSLFGAPNYCTSFFTRGIWMAITSSLLCLGILLVGIYRLMAIKSNDRFDDPKGKPLVIKAQE